MWVEKEPQKVHVIDPFNCHVTLECGRLVQFSELEEEREYFDNVH